jgi:hypothetical protein
VLISAAALLLHTILQEAVAPVALKTTRELVALLPAAAGDIDRLRALLSALRLCCRIFYSLNAPGLTPVSLHLCMARGARYARLWDFPCCCTTACWVPS